jgi:hypothetical protein
MIPEELGKGLDATREVAITAGKALDTVNGFGGFLGKLFGPPMSEATGYLGDQISFWRRMNGLKFEQKFQRRCEQLGFSPDCLRPPPLSLTYRVLEAASLEEADEIQELWAELLAKSIDPTTNFVASKLHISLLREIGPPEANLLEALNEIAPLLGAVNTGYQNLRAELKNRDQEIVAILGRKWQKFSLSDRDLAVKNLTRLDCIAWASPQMPNLRHMLQEKAIEIDSSRHRQIKVTEVDAKKFESFVQWTYSAVEASTGARGVDQPTNATFHDVFGRVIATMQAPETGLRLTSLGKNLLAACKTP